jgi:hypothetical protein
MKTTTPQQRTCLKVLILTSALLFSIYFVHAQEWHLTGNAGTVPGTNFLGTTDAKALMFKVKNQRSGYIDSATANTSFGFQALKNPTKNNNAAFGYRAAYSISTGVNNTALGSLALFSITTGALNTASGYRALYSNKNGNNNTALGGSALTSNSSGNSNTALGNRALFSNTTGYNNVAIGESALFKNRIGNYLVAIGDSALYNYGTRESGDANTAVGPKALYSDFDGSFNTALGGYALYSNTSGNDNTALGQSALNNNGNGEANTGIGGNALRSNTSGGYNTAVGYQALLNITGDENTAVGAFSGEGGTQNQWCTYLGEEADQNTSASLINSMALGFGSSITASNQVRIGNASISSIGGYQNWSNISDGRFKKNIKENVPGLKFINLLNPITYNLDVDELSKFLGEDRTHEVSKQGKGQSRNQIVATKEGKDLIEQGRKEKAVMVSTGFIAQDVEAAAKKIGYDFSGVDKPENEHSPYALRYAEFVVPLVKAVQELSNMNEKKDEKIAAQDSKMEALQKEIDDLKQQVQALINNGPNSSLQSPNSAIGAILQQNTPNPFSQNTTIRCSLPPGVHAAQIAIYNSEGKQLKTYAISNSGINTITINAGTLATGTYNYVLLIDGKVTDTKSMVITK